MNPGLTSLLRESDVRRGRGRPPRTADASGRVDRIRYARACLSGAMRLQEVARAARVHRMTVRRWILELLADGEPDTDELRMMHARRYRRDR